MEENSIENRTYFVTEIFDLIFGNRLIIMQLLYLAIEHANFAHTQYGCHFLSIGL